MKPQPSGQRRSPLTFLIAFLTALILPLALTGGAWAYSTHHHHHARTWTVKVGEQSRNLAIQGMAYLPRNIWINAHDTIRWQANAAEPHTVTFLAKGQKLPAFNPADPNQIGRVNPPAYPAYDGTSYYNSGTMATLPAVFPTALNYRLTFPKVGTFTYWCLLHGAAMKGTVHVRPAGTHYPFTQRQYDRRSAKQVKWILADGYHLWRETAAHATNHRVFAGNDDGIAMVMRFIRPTVYVHVGQKVTWKNIGMGAPHTVTFGKEPTNPFPPSNVANRTDFKGGDLSSGVIPPGGHFTVKFTAAGTFTYICALHDQMGMVGKVVVKSSHHHHHH